MTRLNVLLIVMDTARAQSVLPSENPGVMPNIESFQKEATTFSDAITSAPWTLPSHASMFTGQYTTDHGTNAGSVTFEPEVTPLAEQLRQSGYETMAISNNSWISPEFGFDVGFDHFYGGWELLKGGVDLQGVVRENSSRIQQFKEIADNLTLKNLPRTLLNTAYAWGYHRRYDYGAKFTNYRIKKLLTKTWDQSQPFFLFVNYLEPHLTYDPPEPYRFEHIPDEISREQLESVDQEPWEYLAGKVDMSEDDFRALETLYEGELSYLDYRFGQLFDFLRSEDILDETLILIVGDHGENIGDHGLMDHQYCLYDSLLRVPLILRYPDQVPVGNTTDELVEIRDLYPTVLDLCEVELPADKSVSLFSLLDSSGLNGSKSREEVFAEYTVPQPDVDQLRSRTDDPDQLVFLDSLDRSMRCVRTQNWKYICGTDGSEELFDLDSDPEETTDVSETNPSIMSELQEKLDASFEAFPNLSRGGMEEVDTNAQQRLEDLGYI